MKNKLPDGYYRSKVSNASSSNDVIAIYNPSSIYKKISIEQKKIRIPRIKLLSLRINSELCGKGFSIKDKFTEEPVTYRRGCK